MKKIIVVLCASSIFANGMQAAEYAASELATAATSQRDEEQPDVMRAYQEYTRGYHAGLKGKPTDIFRDIKRSFQRFSNPFDSVERPHEIGYDHAFFDKVNGIVDPRTLEVVLGRGEREDIQTYALQEITDGSGQLVMPNREELVAARAACLRSRYVTVPAAALGIAGFEYLDSCDNSPALWLLGAATVYPALKEIRSGCGLIWPCLRSQPLVVGLEGEQKKTIHYSLEKLVAAGFIGHALIKLARGEEVSGALRSLIRVTTLWGVIHCGREAAERYFTRNVYK